MVRSNVVACSPPREIEQLIARQHPLRMFDEREEHVELSGTEIDQRVRRRTQLPSRHVQAPARKLEDPTRARVAIRVRASPRAAGRHERGRAARGCQMAWEGNRRRRFRGRATRSNSDPFAVSMMIGMVPLARSRRQMLRPSSPGIMMSRMIRSMRAALIVCVIAAASCATETRNPLPVRKRERRPRNSLSSSTTKMCRDPSMAS